jgi:hypothetical protein
MRIWISRSPRGERSRNLTLHGSAHGRINLQEHAIDPRVHQRGERIGGKLFCGFVGQRATIGCDCDRPPAKAGRYRDIHDRDISSVRL